MDKNKLIKIKNALNLAKIIVQLAMTISFIFLCVTYLQYYGMDYSVVNAMVPNLNLFSWIALITSSIALLLSLVLIKLENKIYKQ